MRLKPTGDVEINIGILAVADDVLWRYRNSILDFQEETGYKISMMLAKDRETVGRVMTFVPGGFDILIVEVPFMPLPFFTFIEKLLKRKDDLVILFQDTEREDIRKEYPGVIFVPNEDTLMDVLKEKIKVMMQSEIMKTERD